MDYFKVDIPFNNRHKCWFCGEPSDEFLDYPRRIDFEAKSHLPISLPVCNECDSLIAKEPTSSIYDLKIKLTHKNLKKYARVLGLGINWTKLELENEQLSGASFIGFNESAWAMYEIAKQRIGFKSWPLTYDGIPFDMIDDSYFFESEDIKFIDVGSAIDHYCDAEGLNKELMRSLTDILGEARFRDVLRVSRTNVDLSRKEVLAVIREIEQQERDRETVFKRNQLAENGVGIDLLYESVSPVTIGNTKIEADEIQWLLSNGIKSYEQLCENEDLFFDDYHHAGGFKALELFNGLQVYLGLIEDEDSNFTDPNLHLWSKMSLPLSHPELPIDKIEVEPEDDEIAPLIYEIGKQFKAVGELKTGSSTYTAVLIFDDLSDKKIVQELIKLHAAPDLSLKQVSKESDEETEWLFLEGKYGSSMTITIKDN